MIRTKKYKMTLEQKLISNHKPHWHEINQTQYDPITFYQENYAGLGARQLAKQDPSLYFRLKSDKTLTTITHKQQNITFDHEPLEYYTAHYKGLNPAQLRRKNPQLYRVLRDNNLLSELEQPTSKYSDPIVYYHSNYPNLTQTELRKKDRRLYEVIKEDQKIHLIPKQKN